MTHRLSCSSLVCRPSSVYISPLLKWIGVPDGLVAQTARPFVRWRWYHAYSLELENGKRRRTQRRSRSSLVRHPSSIYRSPLMKWIGVPKGLEAQTATPFLRWWCYHAHPLEHENGKRRRRHRLLGTKIAHGTVFIQVLLDLPVSGHVQSLVMQQQTCQYSQNRAFLCFPRFYSLGLTSNGRRGYRNVQYIFFWYK